MKTCSKCKEEKDYDGFYRDKAAKDGYNCVCKACRLKMDRERRKNDPAWVAKRKLQLKHFHEENRESIAERKKLWGQTPKGRISHILSSRKWKRDNVTKVRAHDAVYRAVKNGIIIPKTNCEVCGSTNKIEAHHQDYRKTLSVIWLCKRCHEELT